jgi:hypothetical protein
MNYQHLLQQRDALLRQARLANVAYAYARLRAFEERILRARLRGAVTLQLADPEAGRPWPVLISEDGSQAVIEEYFLDRDIFELADILRYIHDDPAMPECAFRFEDFGRRFLPALRRELLQAGLTLEAAPPSALQGGTMPAAVRSIRRTETSDQH